jgi:hypothetical protein
VGLAATVSALSVDTAVEPYVAVEVCWPHIMHAANTSTLTCTAVLVQSYCTFPMFSDIKFFPTEIFTRTSCSTAVESEFRADHESGLRIEQSPLSVEHS